ncbi:hypothetical protein MRX96_036104 [Rhipicephalus microplus]
MVRVSLANHAEEETGARGLPFGRVARHECRDLTAARPAISDGGDMWREQGAQLGVGKRNLARLRGCCNPFLSSSRGAYASRISDRRSGSATSGNAAHRLHPRKRGCERMAVRCGGAGRLDRLA